MKVLGALGITLFAAWSCVELAASAPQATQTVDPQVRKQQIAAYSNYGPDGGLAAAASVNGFFELQLHACGEDPAKTLEQLVSFSDAIVFGSTGRNAARLQGKAAIVSDHQFTVDRSLKGSLSKGDVVDVTVLGGTVTFPNGNVARITTPDAFPMGPGRRYLVFLRAANDVEKQQHDSGPLGSYRLPDYLLVSGCQGEYPVDKNGGLIAFGPTSKTNTLSRELAGRKEASITSTVLKIVARERSGK